jgi:hypothetical protein
MILIIFLLSTLLFSFGVVIYDSIDSFRDRKEYKEAEKNLQIGDKYMCTLNNGENPFFEPIILEVTIIDKKYDGENRLWVRYKHLDDSIGMERFERFYDNFEKIIE